MQIDRYLPILKAMNNLGGEVRKRASRGERIMGSLFPNRGTGWPGGWSQDRLEQVLHLKNWTGVAINAITMKLASVLPNIAYVVAGKTQKSTKACQRGLMNATDKGFGGTPIVSHGPHSWITIGELRSKALSVVKPHEELEPLDNDHLLRRVIENPNPYDTHFDFTSERDMFSELCGVDYVWEVPNDYGVPVERWVLPSHWVWPRTGGRVPDGGTGRKLRDSGKLSSAQYDRDQEVGDYLRYNARYVNPWHPDADRLIQYYEVRPWGGMGSAGILRLPPSEVTMRVCKSPLNKIDGYSKLSMVAQWIDEEEAISRSRWSQAMNVARPEFWIKLGPGYEDPDDDRTARVEAKIMAKLEGEYNYGKPVITPPGAEIQPLSFNPTEMAYFQSEEQIRDMILSTFGVPKSVVGIQSEMTYGSLLASLAQFCAYCLNPRLAKAGETDTKYLASRWDEKYSPWSSNTGRGYGSSGGTRHVRLWYDDCVPADPAQVNSDMQADGTFHALTANEVRALRGRKPYRFGGDDPIVQGGPFGVTVIPLNSGKEAGLEKLVEAMKPMSQAGVQEKQQQQQQQMQQQQQLGAPQGPQGPHQIGQPFLSPESSTNGEAGAASPSSQAPDNGEDDMANDSAGIKKPNSNPSKWLHREQEWDRWFFRAGKAKEWAAVKSTFPDADRRERWATILEMNRLSERNGQS